MAGKKKTKKAATSATPKKRTAKKATRKRAGNPPVARNSNLITVTKATGFKRRKKRASNPPLMKPAAAAIFLAKAAGAGAAAVGLTGLAQQFSQSVTMDKVISVGVPLAVAGLGYLLKQPAVMAGGAAVAGQAVMSLISEKIAASRLAQAAPAAPAAAQNPPISLAERRALQAAAERTPFNAPPLRQFAA